MLVSVTNGGDGQAQYPPAPPARISFGAVRRIACVVTARVLG